MKVKNINDRVLVFPDQGKLLVGSDLHGNKKDYLQLMEIFSKEADSGKEIYLLWLGDLIHGPQRPEKDFAYSDESDFILEHFLRMKKNFPDQLFSLMGNHEHGHVGGPHTSKFCEDEVKEMSRKAGEKYWTQLALMKSFPLLALTPAGITFTHGAPSESVGSLQDILEASYSGHTHREINEMYSVPVLDLLWMRGCTEKTAKHFLRRVKYPGLENRLAVYGHDIIREGFERENPHSLVLSTSFGVEEKHKTYLDLDLSRSYHSTLDIREGIELKKLYLIQEKGEVPPFVQKAFEQGRFAAVIHNLEPAPDSPLKHQLLGTAYLRAEQEKDLEKAIHCLKNYLEYDLSSADTHLLLASAYEELADQELSNREAGDHLCRAISHCREADTYCPSYHLFAKQFKERLGKKLDDLCKALKE